MNRVNEFIKNALVNAISKTVEDMAYEQVELIEEDRENESLQKTQSLPQEAIATLGEADQDGEETSRMETAPQVDKADDQDQLWTTIPLLKPLRGELALVFDSGYARVLTESIYGDTEEVDMTAVTVLDAVAEIMNTIAGRFIGSLISEDREFMVGLPNTGQGEPPEFEDEVLTLRFEIGGNYLSAILSGDDFRNYEEMDNSVKERAL